MRHLYIIMLLSCLVCSNICFAFASNELIPSKESSEQAASIYANCAFTHVTNETMGEITGIASDEDGWIYVLKNGGTERKVVDIYNNKGEFCTGINYMTDSACGLLQIEGTSYLYFVRGQFAFQFENGKLSASLYSFNDPSGRYAYANYSANCRDFPNGTLVLTSGNSFLKALGCMSKVELYLKDSTTTVFDATGYCSGKFTTIIILSVVILSVAGTGLTHYFKLHKKKK